MSKKSVFDYLQLAVSLIWNMSCLSLIGLFNGIEVIFVCRVCVFRSEHTGQNQARFEA